jgi:hypothetical protein
VVVTGKKTAAAVTEPHKKLRQRRNFTCEGNFTNNGHPKPDFVKLLRSEVADAVKFLRSEVCFASDIKTPHRVAGSFDIIR